MIAYSTASGSLATDGMGRNELYTSKLMKHMMTPGLSIEEMFKNVRLKVMNATNKAQVLWESSSMTGDFYFIPGDMPKKPRTKSSPTISLQHYHMNVFILLCKAQDILKRATDLSKKAIILYLILY